ncbi:hypothetical protein QOZ80_6AG0534100 [Eleusine coracana subsp. coracana]|nr:hypothetical protein QOZ80_6AG0534100 [Eleusine coracana subsp. coracana]
MVAYPCLVRGHEIQTAFSLRDQKLHQVDMPELHENRFVVTPQGWILTVAESGSAYLLNPQNNSRVDLPALEDDLPEQRRCVLSGNDGSAPGCGVLVLDLTSSVMWYCRVGGRRWSKHSYDIGCYNLPTDYCPVPKKRNIFDVAAVDGSFFFVESHSELGTLDFTADGPADDDPEARLGAIAVVPSLSDDLGGGDYQQMCVAMTYLLESCGDLYFAPISFYDACLDRPGTVRVYKMDFSAPAWRRTEDIGDRAFLLGRSNFGASCSASEHSLEVIRTFEQASATQEHPRWIVPVAI